MGDIKRFEVFADFIERNFPARYFPRVIDVAGGGGYLSLELILRGYEPVLVDPRKTNVRKKVRKERRKEMAKLERRFELFTPDMAADADLVVGMHPDGATEAICEAASFAHVALVPCCNYWRGRSGPIEDIVIGRLREIGDPWEAVLPMSGKNRVMVSKPRGWA